MPSLKHVGRVMNTGRRCVIVFRQMYDEKGNVIDENNCLVFESETLPDAEHQDLMRIVESEPAQTNSELYNILARTRLGSGNYALSWLSQTNRLRKYPTNNVELTPDSRTSIRLDQLNKIVGMQQQGASKTAVEEFLRSQTDMTPSSASVMAAEANTVAPATPDVVVLDDATIAKRFLEEATMFDQQAIASREKAYELDPSLKPVNARKKPTSAK